MSRTPIGKLPPLKLPPLERLSIGADPTSKLGKVVPINLPRLGRIAGKKDALLVDEMGNAVDLLQADINRANAARERYDAQNDFGFYLCVYFVTSGQREEFVEAMGWGHLIDDDPRYVSGLKLAEFEKVEPPLTEAPCIVDPPPKAVWAELAEDLPQEKRGQPLDWPPK